MSAASSAATQVRRNAASSHAPSPQSAAQPAIVFADSGDEIRINLGDIPLQQESMDIEGFKPTLLSRLLDFIVPLKK